MKIWQKNTKNDSITAPNSADNKHHQQKLGQEATNPKKHKMGQDSLAAKG